jgi:hypothetical protein
MDPSDPQRSAQGGSMSDGIVVVDPRNEMDAQIARAFEIMIEAQGYSPPNPNPTHPIDYKPEALDELIFNLSMALVQLVKVPGGYAAKERSTTTIIAEMRKRNMSDIPEKVALREDAKAIVKQAFGDDIDLTPGTLGSVLVRLVQLDIDNKDGLRAKLAALASQL